MHGSESPAAIPHHGERGPHRYEAREISVPRQGMDGGFGARLFVPLVAGTDEADPLAGSPVFAFGHGYLVPIELCESTLAHLASWGITVVAPRSGGGPLPSHERPAADLIGIVCGRPSLDAEAQRALGRMALTAWLRAEAMGDPAAREHAWRADPAGRVTLEARGQEPV